MPVSPVEPCPPSVWGLPAGPAGLTSATDGGAQRSLAAQRGPSPVQLASRSAPGSSSDAEQALRPAVLLAPTSATGGR
eukprot:4978484-Alexandrium_andersonii.AAC.1